MRWAKFDSNEHFETNIKEQLQTNIKQHSWKILKMPLQTNIKTKPFKLILKQYPSD